MGFDFFGIVKQSNPVYDLKLNQCINVRYAGLFR